MSFPASARADDDDSAPETPATASSRWPLVALLLLLIASATLRIVLVGNGGQMFWLDESHRFHPCLQVVDAIRWPNHTWEEVADVVARQHLHTGFLFVGIPVTVVALRVQQWFQVSSIQTAAAYVLSFMSVLSIVLVYRLARRLGAGRWEAVLASFLLAATNCMFYYARHVLPYDSSLALSLFTSWLALGPRRSVGRWFLIGLLGGAAYLIYFGYLTLVLAITTVAMLRGRRVGDLMRGRGLGEVVAHGLAFVGGFVVLPLAMHAFTLVHSAGQRPFLNDVFALMQLADQGGYAEGWAIPWAYLWFNEHGLFLVWLAGAAGVLAFRRHGAEASRTRGIVWLAIAGLVYFQLAFNSTVMHKAVVLGRFARQLVPFLCLATAAAARDLADRGRVSRLGWTAAALAIVAQAALNFSVPLGQWFAPDVEAEAARLLGRSASLTRDVSVVGPEWSDPVDHSARYVLLNTATFLYPAKDVAPPLRGVVLIRHPHPLQFRPYQYEVYDAAGRTVLQTADISMRLVDTGVAGSAPGTEVGAPQ
jgi:hypothetical protein